MPHLVTDITPDLLALADLAASGLFDAAFYRRANPDISDTVRPLLHYFAYGASEGRAPNAYFDPVYYRAHHAPEPLSGLNLLLHYVREGEPAGDRPSSLFDPGWYRRAYAVPSDASPLADFLRHQHARAPLPGFWAIPRLAPWNLEPDPVAAYVAAHDGADPPPVPDAGIIRRSELFDENYYLINGTDVLSAALDPIEHFCAFGAAEGRNPGFYFDTAFYGRTNPEIARHAVNPLVHYILHGEAAGRRPVAWFDPAWYRARYRVDDPHPLAHWMAHRRSQAFSPTPLFDVAFYMDAHRELVGPNRDPFAHYLQAGMTRDLDPSPHFDAAGYRRRTMGRPSRHFRGLLRPETDNPLIHHLLATYA